MNAHPKRGRPRKDAPASIRTKRLPPGVANPVDVHAGARVRLRRTLLGMSQERLGELVGLTFQQIQKYEKGTNRMGASRLFEFSRILEVPVSFFFDDMPDNLGTAAGRYAAGMDRDEDAMLDPLAKRETLELVRAYYKIASPAARKQLFALTKAMAGMGDGGE